jgi:FkbH-like protein
VSFTKEDAERAASYAANAQREALRGSAQSMDDFLRGLGMEVRFGPVGTLELERSTQLINKTNQFNLTTVRRTQDEIEALAGAKDALVLGMDIKDKYGDYGLVGVSILKKQNKTCLIDTLLMSCRVLGRGAEATFLAKLAEAAKSLGCDEMRGKYIPTPKNAMVKDLYQRFNFTHDAKTGEWVVKIAEAPKTPAHIDAALKLTG